MPRPQIVEHAGQSSPRALRDQSAATLQWRLSTGDIDRAEYDRQMAIVRRQAPEVGSPDQGRPEEVAKPRKPKRPKKKPEDSEEPAPAVAKTPPAAVDLFASKSFGGFSGAEGGMTGWYRGGRSGEMRRVLSRINAVSGGSAEDKLAVMTLARNHDCEKLIPEEWIRDADKLRAVAARHQREQKAAEHARLSAARLARARETVEWAP